MAPPEFLATPVLYVNGSAARCRVACTSPGPPSVSIRPPGSGGAWGLLDELAQNGEIHAPTSSLGREPPPRRVLVSKARRRRASARLHVCRSAGLLRPIFAGLLRLLSASSCVFMLFVQLTVAPTRIWRQKLLFSTTFVLFSLRLRRDFRIHNTNQTRPPRAGALGMVGTSVRARLRNKKILSAFWAPLLLTTHMQKRQNWSPLDTA